MKGGLRASPFVPGAAVPYCQALGCVSFLFAVSERGVLFGAVRVQTRSVCDDAGTPEA